MPDKPLIPTAITTAMPPIEILDIGAMAEGEERFARLVKQGLANVSGFEPNPAEFERLRARNAPRRRYLPYFLGKGGPATFHLTRYPGCCSLYEPDPAIIDLFQAIGATLPTDNFAVIGTERVSTVRLDDVPDLPPCDFMKLDVQGAELDVLRGGTTCLAHVLVLEAEVEFIPLYKNQPLFGHIQSFLQEHHFLLHKFVDIIGRSLRPMVAGNPYGTISQVLWADAIFVRDYSNDSLYSDAQLLKAAVILYDTYDSYDLSYYLLRKYDQRRGTAFAKAFLDAISTVPDLPFTYMNLKRNA
jgi:FkbM family methyltransferase